MSPIVEGHSEKGAGKVRMLYPHAVPSRQTYILTSTQLFRKIFKQQNDLVGLAEWRVGSVL